MGLLPAGRLAIVLNNRMSIVWDQRIRHTDRKVKRRDYRLLATSDREMRRRERSGVPSRAVPSELAFEGIWIRIDARTKTPAEILARKIGFELKLIRSRMLERKRRMKDLVRSRKITRDRTCIYLWKRRREWLAMAEA